MRVSASAFNLRPICLAFVTRRVVEVNIQIMRTVRRLREMLLPNKELQLKIEHMEKKYDTQFKVVFDVIRQLMKPDEPKKRKIGFGRDKDA